MANEPLAQQLGDIRLRLLNKAEQLGIMGQIGPEIAALSAVEAELATEERPVTTLMVDAPPAYDISKAQTPRDLAYLEMQAAAAAHGIPTELMPTPDHPAFQQEPAPVEPTPEPVATEPAPAAHEPVEPSPAPEPTPVEPTAVVEPAPATETTPATPEPATLSEFPVAPAEGEVAS